MLQIDDVLSIVRTRSYTIRLRTGLQACVSAAHVIMRIAMYGQSIHFLAFTCPVGVAGTGPSISTRSPEARFLFFSSTTIVGLDFLFVHGLLGKP